MSLVRSRESVSTTRTSRSQSTSAVRTSSITAPMVHDRIRSEADRVARTDRADVQIDVFGGDEPLVEAADLVEDGLPVGQIRGRVRDVGPVDEQLHPFELFEGPVADLDRPAGDDVISLQSLAEFLEPERIRDRVAVDEGDRLALRFLDAEVPAGPARAAEDVQVDEVVLLLIPAYDVARRILAGRVDHEDLEGRPLDDQAVQQCRDVARFVPNRGDDADEQRGC